MTVAAQPSLVQQASRVREALDALHHALAAGDPHSALQVEPQIAAVLGEWATRVTPAAIDDETRRAVTAQVRAARRSLDQCRATGAAIATLNDATTRALRGDAAYDPMGRASRRTAVRGRGVRTRG